LALVEGCKHEIEVSIPAGAVEQETGKVAEQFQKRVQLKGFRVGKVPLSLIRKTYAADIRQKVLEILVPRFFDEKAKDENLRVVGTPNVTDVHTHPSPEGDAVHFKAEFEVFPEFELTDYVGVQIPYTEPTVSDEDVDARIAEILDQKATYVNEEPRAIVEGDYAVVSLESVAGAPEPIKSDEVQVLIGGPETMPGFTENLTGAMPGDEKQFDVTYPEDYGRDALAGQTVTFQVKVKGLRRKELPELNDEFAQDLGDFRTVDELKAAVRKSIFGQRQTDAERAAKDRVVEKLVDLNQFPVPEAFVDRQIENRVNERLQALEQQGVDTKSFNLDWAKVKEAQREDAVREVRASLILGRVAEKEAIGVTNDEVDREVNVIARKEQEAVASVRKKLAANGTLDRIASHIQTQKTLNFLFDKAVKTAE
jgi:trigger factor